MKKQIPNNTWSMILVWGSLWGIAEATIGYALHFVPWLAGFVMFPIGFFFMKKAMDETKNLSSIFYTAAVASAIKMTGLLLPYQDLVRVVNPSVCILLESVVVMFFYKLAEYKGNTFQLKEALLTALGWRVVFIGYHLVLLSLSLYDGILDLGWMSGIRFLVLESLVNGLIIYFCLKYIKIKTGSPVTRTPAYKPLFSLSIFTFAVFIELII
jgi:hypothetical protein